MFRIKLYLCCFQWPLLIYLNFLYVLSVPFALCSLVSWPLIFLMGLKFTLPSPCRDLFWAPKLNISSFLSPYTALFYSCHLLLLDDIFSSYFPPKNVRSIFITRSGTNPCSLYIVWVQYMFIMWMNSYIRNMNRKGLSSSRDHFHRGGRESGKWEYWMLVLFPHN